MGLDVMVGVFQQTGADAKHSFLEKFANLNQVLLQNGLPAHQEPERIPDRNLFEVPMFGYSGLHYLRRIALYLWQHNSLPEPGTEETLHDSDDLDLEYSQAILSAEASLPFEHLLMHSDSDGFYLPIQFQNVVYEMGENFIIRQMIGSSYTLQHECEILARYLGLPLDLENDEEFAELIEELAFVEVDITNNTPLWQHYRVESYTCYWLYRACQQSIHTGAAVVFT